LFNLLGSDSLAASYRFGRDEIFYESAFYPGDYGGGLGHVSRCVPLAEEFRRQGDDCAFIITKNHRKLL